MKCVDYVPFKGYVETMVSLTEPDQSLSIREVIDRFSIGLPVNSHDGYYDECPDDEFDIDPTRTPGFDFFDAYDLAETTASNIAQAGETAKHSEANEPEEPLEAGVSATEATEN